MKCIELAKILMETPDREVLIAKDGEGNSFSKLWEVTMAAARQQKREYEVGIEILTPDLSMKGYTEKDVIEDGEKVVILWP